MASNSKLTDKKVIIFDVYGTLMDWESGIYNALQPLLSKYDASKSWSRKEALSAFGSVETDLQTQFPEMPYSELLSKVHEVIEQRLRALSSQDTDSATLDAAPVAPPTLVPGESPAEPAASTSAGAGSSAPSAGQADSPYVAFGSSIKNWPIFPDTAEALKRLSRYYKLVVLSNVDRESFQHTHAILSEGSLSTDITPYLYPTPNPNNFWHPQESSGSNSPFTVIATAQDTGCYKPALGGFQALFKYFEDHPGLFGDLGGDVKSKVISVAQSLPHDHVPANRLGIDSVWIDRQSAVTCNELPGGQRPWTWRFETLAEFADTVEKEAGSV